MCSELWRGRLDACLDTCFTTVTIARVRRRVRLVQGTQSPLRHQVTLASCRSGGHAIWWTVDAASEKDALELLPFYVAKRTTIARVSEVQIP